MRFQFGRGDRRRRLGHGAGRRRRARRPRGDALRAQRRERGADAGDARQSETARRAPRRRASTITGDIARAARADIILIATPAQNLREAATALAPHLDAGDARRRLRQGHRARHAQIHDRGDRGSRAGRDAGDPVGTELCRRRRARPSDRRDAGGKGRRRWRARWCRRWARRPSGPITPRTSAASRSAARPRTCWRSRPASSSAGSSAPRRRRR